MKRSMQFVRAIDVSTRTLRSSNIESERRRVGEGLQETFQESKNVPRLRRKHRISCILRSLSLPLNAYNICMFNPLEDQPLEMQDSSLQDDDLIEICEDYYHLKYDEPDESRYLHLLNAVLSGTARLNVLLPTATILAFTIFAPLLTNDGACSSLNRWTMGVFWAVLAASCVFFTLTDSFRTGTGRVYYGVVTFRGIWTFNGGRKKPNVSSDYKLRWSDLFHASLSLVAFLAFAASVERN